MNEIVVDGKTLDLTVPEGRMKLAELKAAAIRLRNYGAAVSTIADTLKVDEATAEFALSTGLKELTMDSAAEIRARQQATINDIRRAMYPAMTSGDQGAAKVIMQAMNYEGEIHGVKAPQRIAVGMDQETFTTTVAEDLKVLMAPDPPPPDDGEPWANT